MVDFPLPYNIYIYLFIYLFDLRRVIIGLVGVAGNYADLSQQIGFPTIRKDQESGRSSRRARIHTYNILSLSTKDFKWIKYEYDSTL